MLETLHAHDRLRVVFGPVPQSNDSAMSLFLYLYINVALFAMRTWGRLTKTTHVVDQSCAP